MARIVKIKKLFFLLIYYNFITNNSIYKIYKVKKNLYLLILSPLLSFIFSYIIYSF